MAFGRTGSANNWYEEYTDRVKEIKEKEKDDPPFVYLCTLCGKEEELDITDTITNYQIWYYCSDEESCERNRIFVREDKVND